MLDFDAFAARAHEVAASIPAEFMEGIESVDVHREVKQHAFLEDVVTLGECITSPLSDPTGQEPFRSTVHLYHGSFAQLAREDPRFDVEAELRETIEHEVQHHLEDRAGMSALRDEDDLFEAHARFRTGMDVPDGWYRQGERLADGLWAVDLDLFLELTLRRPEWNARLGTVVRLHVLGEDVEFELPADASPDEAFTLEGEGLFEGDEDDEGAEREAEEEEEEGVSGDLHVIPVVR